MGITNLKAMYGNNVLRLREPLIIKAMLRAVELIS